MQFVDREDLTLTLTLQTILRCPMYNGTHEIFVDVVVVVQMLAHTQLDFVGRFFLLCQMKSHKIQFSFYHFIYFLLQWFTLIFSRFDLIFLTYSLMWNGEKIVELCKLIFNVLWNQKPSTIYLLVYTCTFTNTYTLLNFCMLYLIYIDFSYVCFFFFLILLASCQFNNLYYGLRDDCFKLINLVGNVFAKIIIISSSSFY